VVTAAQPRPVYFLVLPRTYALDLFGALDPFRQAVRDAPQAPPFTLHFVGPVAAPETSCGLTLGTIAPLPANVPERAVIVLAGLHSGDIETLPESRRAIDWLATTIDLRHHILATVCSGALLAARAGLLDGRKCTTHHQLTDRLQALAPAALVQENRIFVQDGNLFTSAGVTAGMDLALHLVSRFAGPQIAAAAAREMVVFSRRAGNDPQLSPFLMHRNHLHPAVHRVQDAVIAAPQERWSLTDMARSGHISVRHLDRLFAEHAGIKPLGYVQSLRVALARQAIQGGVRALEKVAQMAGFTSAQQLRRAWFVHCQGTPKDFVSLLTSEPQIF
jgi:transcriptional regulator GlxA family with amidase domain